MLNNFKPVRVKSEKHRRFIASLPCLITGATDTQCAHIRKGNGGGMGYKPSDCCCVPLSCAQHALQGERGEIVYWKPYGGTELATNLAKALYECTGNKERALELIREFRDGESICI